MKGKLLLSLVSIFLIGTTATYGQQSAQFSQYMFNTLFYNPAYAGIEGVTTLTAFHRTQWAGYQPTNADIGGGISTQVISLNAPMLRLRSGFGLHFVSDRIGPLTNLQGQLSFAYHLGVGDGKLSLGVRAGFFSQTTDFDEYRPVDSNDPYLLYKGKINQTRPDFAAGIFYRARQYYVGVGVQHLLDTQFDFNIDTLNNPLANYMTVTGGFDYEPTYKVKLTPSFLVQSDLNTYSFDVSVIATYDDTMWGGLSFRQQEAIIGMLGYSFFKDKALKLGYAFDYTVVAPEAKSTASHEIMVRYSLPVSSASDKKVVRTPRFRQ